MYFFLHIPKTGGTTVKNLFFEAFDVKNCVKVWDKNFGADTDPRDFPNLCPDFLSKKKVILGHLPFQEFLKNHYISNLYKSGNVKSITILRDPIDRIISLRNYVCAMENHPGHKMAILKEPKDFVFQQEANFQYNFLIAFYNESVNSIYKRIRCFPLEGSEEKVRIWLENEIKENLPKIKPQNVTKKKFPTFNPVEKSDFNEITLNALKIKHNKDFALYDLAREGYGI